jgi:hypothetical protein
MKLKEKQVEAVVRKVIEVLKQKSLITFKHPEGAVFESMKSVFISNLREEEAINQEAEKLLIQARKASGSQIDEKKLYFMIKKELCKKKNFIL